MEYKLQDADGIEIGEGVLKDEVLTCKFSEAWLKRSNALNALWKYDADLDWKNINKPITRESVIEKYYGKRISLYHRLAGLWRGFCSILS